MARPRTITDEQIVDAAREVFLEHGFSATTAEIARRAGVSEGTLFKRFSSKEELFAETVGLNDYQHWHHEVTALIGQGDIRLNLERLAHLFLEAARRILPNLMLMWSRGHAPSVKAHAWRDPVAEDIRALSAYFEAETALGRLRSFDAEVIATALMGALSTYAHRELVRGPTIEGERFVRELLDVLWPGLEPPSIGKTVT
ncbi:TetR/AcrR family transcriptional regulator [Deinococcus sp.]|uniref:TetR/AcrR family transcriptional regulator n=1 Tax=Deinococcus sp. TaxID=47478 RepID=UPI0025DDA27E|nr:TetR/AcrR family transcriptional regulator [Deinococcus sp.]